MASKPGRLSDGMPQLSNARKARIDAFMPYVSVLPWFNVDVLHKLYLNVFARKHQDVTAKTKEHTAYDLRTITCADFLQSPQVARIDYNVFVINSDLRETLRNELKEDQPIMKKIGEFMLAYADQCRDHFLSTRYVEVYRIEGNLIVNPAAEAGRIAQHVAQQLNNKRDLSKMVPSVAYFLNMLDQDDQAAGNEELRTFLKGMESYLNKNKEQAAKEWEKLPGKENGGDSISIRLPAEIRKTILDNIKQARPQVQNSVRTRRLFAVIVGIDEYEGGVPKLNSCVKDAKEMDRLLRELAGEQETMEYHPHLLLSLDATRESIKDAFFHFRGARADRGDVCLFYFAGHGSQEMAVSGIKVGDKHSTLICADSRTEGGFDLLDVELSYLLYQATSEAHEQATTENELHTLVILDCSHSGGFNREGTGNISQQSTQLQAARALGSVLGYNAANNHEKAPTLATYVDALQKWQSLPLVSLAATQPHQVAMEMMIAGENVGLFTWSLLQELKEKDGAKKTYPELLESLKQSISERNDKQVPMLNITASSTREQLFLGGIFNPIDKAVPGTKINVYLDQSTVPNMLLQDLIGRIPDNAPFTFINEKKYADFVVDTTEDVFIITEIGTGKLPIEVPLGAVELVEHLGAIGRWCQVKLLENQLTTINRNDFELRIEAFAGITEEEIETTDGEVFNNPDAITLNYKEVEGIEVAPIYKAQLTPFTEEACYVVAVFLGSRYSVIATTKVVRVEPKEKISLLQLEEGQWVYPFMSMRFNDEYLGEDETEVTDYLKIIISRTPFSIDDWEEEELPLFDMENAVNPAEVMESIDFESVFRDEDNWTTITIPITTTRPLPEAETVASANWHPLSAHTAPVLSVAYSPDGRFALTGSTDGTAKVWDNEFGHCVLSVKEHAGAINCVVFSTGGATFVTGSADNTAKLWDAYSGECLHTFTGHTGPVLAVAFSPDGQFLVTGSEDRTHKVWSREGSLLHSVDHTSAVTTVAISEDGKFVYTGNEAPATDQENSQNKS